MLFNTAQYLSFLLIVVLVYYICPGRWRYIWLLMVSYFFYMQWNAAYIVLLFSSTLLTYGCARVIDRIRTSEKNEELWTKYRGHKQKLCFVLCIIMHLCILGFFKYFEFGINCINHVLAFLHIDQISWNIHILLPVGISFYILQALGYLIDVYRGNIEAEKNFMRYALFVSFFPQLVAGPIERSNNLLVQLRNPQKFSYDNIRRGLLLLLYGLFTKMVIADRAAIIVDTVYKDSAGYPGFYIVVATFFFAIQIYCDFYGYSTIARGSALLLGIWLMDNFDAPYFSKSVKEFWRRWHVSLSGWFRDYLYIPLGGNRKGEFRKQCNLLLVFGISGLWHGASLSFLSWGLLNGIYQVASNGMMNIRCMIKKWTCFIPNFSFTEERTGIDKNIASCFSKRLLQTVATFMMITFAWLFFRADGMYNAYEILVNMFRLNNGMILFDGSLYTLGVARNSMNILLLSIAALFIVDYHKYHDKDVVGLLLKQQWYFRTMIIMLLVFTILLYGCYGELYDVQQFIYFQF